MFVPAAAAAALRPGSQSHLVCQVRPFHRLCTTLPWLLLFVPGALDYLLVIPGRARPSGVVMF